MTKYLYPAPAQLRINILVRSVYNGRIVKTEQIGTNSMLNASKQLKSKIENAIKNAKMKHLAKVTNTNNPDYLSLSNSDIQIEIIDFDIKYFKDLTTIKRENINGRYYSVARSKSGKVLGRNLWKKANIS